MPQDQRTARVSWQELHPLSDGSQDQEPDTLEIEVAKLEKQYRRALRWHRLLILISLIGIFGFVIAK